jgi:hypothetical protein
MSAKQRLPSCLQRVGSSFSSTFVHRPEAVVSINQLTLPPMTAANEVVENGVRRTPIETA